jgi:sugar lactone lactonase YvrE
MLVVAIVAALVAIAAPVSGEVVLPSGFTARVYVTGDGFAQPGGLPSSSTLVVDDAGILYLARTGRRFTAGEVDDLFPLYRIPVGGARLTPATEARYFYGPPLPNPQVGAMRSQDLLVTTFDRDRKIGVLYRLRDGAAELLAGGTPPRGETPLLRQPEGVAVDGHGNIYVADREQGTVVKLDASGRVLERRFAEVTRPRTLAMDPSDRLWIGADVGAEAPWQQGPGEIWAVNRESGAQVVLRGPLAAGLVVAPSGHAIVANRQAAAVVVVMPDGQTLELARFTEGDVPRGLALAPVTPQTRRAGIAGDLFIVVIRRGIFAVNEVVRVAGPLESFIRGGGAPRR